MYKTLLEETGKYNVEIANNGHEGIIFAKCIEPDVILLDVLMPDMNGVDVACELLCNETTKDIPYIFITSLLQPQENNISNKHHYLGKPLDLEDLISVIEETRNALSLYA
jgi:CheY-like chemotaxis protein